MAVQAIHWLVGQFRTLQFKGSRRIAGMPWKFSTIAGWWSCCWMILVSGSRGHHHGKHLQLCKDEQRRAGSLWLVWECGGCHWDAVEHCWDCKRRWHKASTQWLVADSLQPIDQQGYTWLPGGTHGGTQGGTQGGTHRGTHGCQVAPPTLITRLSPLSVISSLHNPQSGHSAHCNQFTQCFVLHTLRSGSQFPNTGLERAGRV